MWQCMEMRTGVAAGIVDTARAKLSLCAHVPFEYDRVLSHFMAADRRHNRVMYLMPITGPVAGRGQQRQWEIHGIN